MGLYTALPDDLQEVDVIVAGGGTAGCVVAGRLAAASPELSILVIEGGMDNFEAPAITTPVLFISHLNPASKTNRFYKSKASAALEGREVVVPAGGVLGGGSSTNMMTYARAQRSDFDSWNMPGWSADEILPYLKKFEHLLGPGSMELHGSDGPIVVSRGPFTSKRCQDDFINAAGKTGFPEAEDLQNLDSVNGAQRVLRYMTPEGKRSDAAHAYLHPKLKDGAHPNLHVLVQCLVERVLIKDGKAVGVVYSQNADFGAGDDGTRTIRAKKSVIVSAGAMGTPAILERSGIGSSSTLEASGVSPVINLPGVGGNYGDHLVQLATYKVELDPEETLDALALGKVDIAEMVKTNNPILGWNGQEVSCKVRPSDEEVVALGPKFQQMWDAHFRDVPDKPLAVFSPVIGFAGDVATHPGGRCLSLSAFVNYPLSRGHLHITGPAASSPLDFDSGFLADPDSLDVVTCRWIYKKGREIMRRMSLFRGENQSDHPEFPPSSAAKCQYFDNALPTDVEDIQYSSADDEAIEKWVRKTISTTWHSMGTCKMAVREENGVVDEKLSVYGVEGLKVVDLSIVPTGLAANTASAAFAIGEKASDIIISELAL